MIVLLHNLKEKKKVMQKKNIKRKQEDLINDLKNNERKR